MSTMDPYAAPAPQLRTQLVHELLDDRVNPDEIVTDAPAEQFRLGYLDVVCLVLNRVIGELSSCRIELSIGTHGAVCGSSSLIMEFQGRVSSTVRIAS